VALGSVASVPHGRATRPNDRVYIHELIDIIGHNRSRYMHHMTANWVPVAIEERNQRCFGVWGTVGSTGRWPEVVNMWELDGWEGLAANFEHEVSHPAMQDPSLAEWWATASSMRRGGVDRVLLPAPWSPTIDELVASEVRGVVYAHELFSTPPGRAPELLDLLERGGCASVEGLGLHLVGAFRVAMAADHEAVVIWAVPDWPTWVTYERAWDGTRPIDRPDRGGIDAWRRTLFELEATVRRTLMVDAPLSPLRLGRQPSVEDRRPLSEL
jgi:hypothetical protein